MAHIHGYSMYIYLFFTLIVVAGLYKAKTTKHNKQLHLT